MPAAGAKTRKRPPQLSLRLRSWGGRRKGAGRKPGPGGTGVSHRVRPKLASRFPVHVGLQVDKQLPSLRRPDLLEKLTLTDEQKLLLETFIGEHGKEK